MKYLTLIRHAQAQPHQKEDFLRKLDRKGEKEAQWLPLFLSRTLQHGNIPLIDKLIASSATRTTETAKRVAYGLGFAIGAIQLEQSVYHAQLHDLLTLLKAVPNRFQHVCLIGHNPTIEWFCKEMLWEKEDKVQAQCFSTASVAVIELEIDHWEKSVLNLGALIKFASPSVI